MSRWDLAFDANLVGFAAISALSLVLNLFGVYDFQLVLTVILPAIFFVGMIVSAAGLARRGESARSAKSSLARNVALFVLIGSLLGHAMVTTLTAFR